MITWLPMALAASPGAAVRAATYMAFGYRVRGRNLIAAAAARHRGFYARWTRLVEPRLIDEWCAGHADCSPQLPTVCAVVLSGAGGDRAQTRGNVERILGAGSLIEPGIDLLATLRAARDRSFEWILFVWDEDCLSPRLGHVIASLGDLSSRNLVYWDHDHILNGRRSLPVIKPDWDPVLAESLSMLGSSAVMRIDAAIALAEGLGRLDNDAEDIERLQLAAAQAKAEAGPLHVPLILTHRSEAAPKMPPVARKRLEKYAHPWPGVTIVIPTRDQAGLLASCIAGLDELAYPGEIETIVLDNDSSEAESIAVLDALRGRNRTRLVSWPGKFNFAAMMNDAVALASNSVLCLLNNDVTPLDGHWLHHMVAAAIRPDCGAVGARLLYPDGTIQHVGVALGVGGAAGHFQKGVDPADPLFANWHQLSRRVSAVTAACLVVEKAKYLSVGGMDAESFGVDFNDVDLCLKLDRAGWANRVVVEATLIHHESKSRGIHRTQQQQQQFEKELHALREFWNTQEVVDPWHNPLFRRESEQCQLRL